MQHVLKIFSPTYCAMLLALVILGCEGEGRDRAAGTAAQVEPEPVVRSAWGGAEIYDEVCDKCHKMGVDGAPKFGDVQAWAPRIAKGEEVLLGHVRSGFNEMPARGRCDFCSDSQLKAAMSYMIRNSQ